MANKVKRISINALEKIVELENIKTDDEAIEAEYKKLAPTDAKPAKSLLRVGKSEVVIDGKASDVV